MKLNMIATGSHMSPVAIERGFCVSYEYMLLVYTCIFISVKVFSLILCFQETKFWISTPQDDSQNNDI